MHLSEGILPIDQSIVWSAAAVPAVIWSIQGEAKARKEDPSSAVLMAGATSLLFAGTLMPLPVPVVGATSHICLTPLLALIVGVRRVIWPTFLILLLHAMFFAHGGMTTLGVNTLTLGLIGPAITVLLWNLFRGLGAKGAVGFGLAVGLGGMSVYVTDAAVLAVALADTANPATTFGVVVVGFAPVQLPLSILEAVVSVYIVRALVTRRIELVPEALRNLRLPRRESITAAVVLMCIGLSGCAYEGIDGTIFSAEAEKAKRMTTDSIVDFSQGEMGLAMTILILFGLGFIAGRCWEKLSAVEQDGLPR